MRTATIIGIDEAGYGPVLGPLVVSAVAFDVPVTALHPGEDPADGPDLWSLLKSSLCRRPSKRSARLAVADSKLLYNGCSSEGGVTLLERAALTFLMQLGEAPATLRGALQTLCPDVLDQLSSYSWYSEDVDLPVACSRGDLATQRNALAAAMTAAGVTFRGAWVEVLTEGHYNQMVSATHNKAVVLFSRTARLIQRVADAVGPQPLRVWVDRQGGRTCYRQALMTAFDDARLDVLEEAPQRSSYRLIRRPCPWVVRFVEKGESRHLPVALASVFSKYIRELFMMCFNRYWAAHVLDLKPTGGYYKDGRRFLADIEAVVASQQIDRHWLVRSV